MTPNVESCSAVGMVNRKIGGIAECPQIGVKKSADGSVSMSARNADTVWKACEKMRE